MGASGRHHRLVLWLAWFPPVQREQQLTIASGRQYAFNLTVLIAAIFGLCLGAPSNYNAILVLTAFNGFGIGGNIPIDTTICLEFLPQVDLKQCTERYS